MKMEILLEPTSNKLMVGDLCDSIRIKLVTTGKKRWCDSIRIKLVPAGNPVKEILLKLNLPDHRKLKDGGEGSLEDKILVPKPPRNCARCARCGTPVDGPYCQGCALLRKEFMEGLFTNCVENEFFKDFQDTSESSDDNTNVVNAPREPIVVNQDPGENSSPSPLHIDHCCHECGDSLDGIFCRQCTCKSCGKGAHYGYNCPPRVPIISNPEPCKNQTIDEPLQNLQSLQQQCLFRTCQKCGCNEYDGVCFYCKVGNETQINVSTPYSSNDSPGVANHPPQPQYVPYSCE
ncbi:hypothetical protein Tco_1116545, partial [Tanacetum coccineum]